MPKARACFDRAPIRIRVKTHCGLAHLKNRRSETLRPLRDHTTCATWVWDRLQNGPFCHLRSRRKPTSGRFSGAATHCLLRRLTTAWRRSPVRPSSARRRATPSPPRPICFHRRLRIDIRTPWPRSALFRRRASARRHCSLVRRQRRPRDGTTCGAASARSWRISPSRRRSARTARPNRRQCEPASIAIISKQRRKRRIAF
jgi:hypothetical protein